MFVPTHYYSAVKAHTELRRGGAGYAAAGFTRRMFVARRLHLRAGVAAPHTARIRRVRDMFISKRVAAPPR